MIKDSKKTTRAIKRNAAINGICAEINKAKMGGQTTINLGREHKDYMDIERKLEGRSQREDIQKLIAKDMGRHPNEAGFAEVIEAI